MKYFLDPFGCVKNQVDAENMMAFLNKAGWENAREAELADLIIVNSCGFIDSAKQESIDAVLQWRKLYPEKKILLSGCLSQRYAKELNETLTEADAIIGVGGPAQIAEKITELGKVTAPLSTGERPLLSLPGSAYVKISEGCSNNCSYCAIPLIRGELVSRTIPSIIKECRTLLKRGIVELNIIGQDIGAYGMDFSQGESKLPQLLNEIAKIKGQFWVRLLYIHPNHFPLQILDLMEKDNRFLPYFDIPFQHASTKILTAMNRNHSELNHFRFSTEKLPAEKYLELIKTIRKRLGQAVIRSTFLLGFPGETEEDFAALLDFQQKAKLDWLGCFAYSREEGTESFSMKGRVSKKTANSRKQTIENNQIAITEKNMERFVGQTMSVLIEERIENPPEKTAAEDTPDENLWLGRLYCQAPDIDGAAVIAGAKNLQTGTLVKCKVIARRGFDLEVAAPLFNA